MMTTFRAPILASLATFVLVAALAGPSAALTVGILAVLELSLSADNAVVNVRVLQLMNPTWQRRFLTIGIIVAVFGMRALFPLLIVSVIATVSPWSALTMALTAPDQYATVLTSAHPVIVGFGGTFLAMVFFTWLFEERDTHWLGYVERPLGKIGVINRRLAKIGMSGLPAIIASSLILSPAVYVFAPFNDRDTMMFAGLIGLITHMIVNGVARFFLNDDASDNVARAGAALFVYIEVLDASFSFDGVIGAFAITNQFLLITAGTGIGAFFVRGMTMEMLRRNTLETYAHLEHGAHWAIGALAVLLFGTIAYEIPETITGLIGASFITASVATSIITRRRSSMIEGQR